MDKLFLWSYSMQINNNLKSDRAIFGAFITVVVFFEAIFTTVANVLWYYTTYGINLKSDYKTAMIISIIIAVFVSAYYLIGFRFKNILHEYDKSQLQKNKKNSLRAMIIVGTTFGFSLLSYFLIN